MAIAIVNVVAIIVVAHADLLYLFDLTMLIGCGSQRTMLNDRYTLYESTISTIVL